MEFITLAIAVGLAVFAVTQALVLSLGNLGVQRRIGYNMFWTWFRLVFYVMAPIALGLWLASISLPQVIGAFS